MAISVEICEISYSRHGAFAICFSTKEIEGIAFRRRFMMPGQFNRGQRRDCQYALDVSNDEAWGKQEDNNYHLAAIEKDGGFDGMLPDPIFEADLFERLERLDSLSSRSLRAYRPDNDGSPARP